MPCKFILQVYRDYVITKDEKFVGDLWETVRETVEYAGTQLLVAIFDSIAKFDSDGDGVIDNEGFPGNRRCIRE